jgi:hypothetical protein
MEKRFANIVNDRETARVHILELDEVPSGCFEQTSSNVKATEVAIEFFLVAESVLADVSYIAAIVREYITAVVCAFHPWVKRAEISWAPDDINIMLGLAAAGFIRSENKPLFVNLPLSVQ